MIALKHVENVTFVAWANAAVCAISPMIIYKRKQLKPEFQDNLPTDGLVAMSRERKYHNPAVHQMAASLQQI